ALPAAYNPQDADLTFNKKNLESFNFLSPKERDAFVEELKSKPGAFRGQAVTEAGNGIGEGVDGAEHGAWETFAHVDDPVLYEITIDYRIFSTEELGRPLGRSLPIAFTGTLVDLRYDAEAKPRKLTIGVKADT